MSNKNEIITADQDKNSEIIIKQHRRWTNWMDVGRILGEGSLILTNRRLLFLNRIQASPDTATAIKELADAPMKTVLDHALTLHKNCFQMQLSSIIQVGVGTLGGFGLPSFCLSVVYLDGKKQKPLTAAFQFRQSQLNMIPRFQIIEDWGWKRAIKRVIQESARPGKR